MVPTHAPLRTDSTPSCSSSNTMSLLTLVVMFVDILGSSIDHWRNTPIARDVRYGMMFPYVSGGLASCSILLVPFLFLGTFRVLGRRVTTKKWNTNSSPFALVVASIVATVYFALVLALFVLVSSFLLAFFFFFPFLFLLEHFFFFFFFFFF
eukprot:Rmarinus@m.8602